MSKFFWGRALFLMMIVIGGTAGCGENIFEGLTNGGGIADKIESARIALDSRDYTSAITILQGLCGADLSNPSCDAETRALLASAYSGRAGLDMINLINKASTGSISSFASFSTLLPSPTANNKSDIGNAVTLLSGISSRTADQNLQMAVLATADIVITVGVDVTNGFNTTGSPNTHPSSASQIPQTTADRVTSDLSLITQGVNGSGLVNKDLTTDINAIKTQLDSNPTNGIVTTSELQTYLAGL